MPDGMPFGGAMTKINNVIEALASSPGGLKEHHEQKRQDLHQRLIDTISRINAVEEGVVPRSLFPAEGYTLIREGLGASVSNVVAYEAVLELNGRQIEKFVSDIEQWVSTLHDHFILGNEAPLPFRPPVEDLLKAADGALSLEHLVTSAIRTAIDAEDPCLELLQGWAEKVWSNLRAYRGYPLEDLEESYGYLAAQIEHLAVITERVEVPEEVVVAINSLLDEIGGPWRNRS